MASPTAPLGRLKEVAATRNDCYNELAIPVYTSNLILYPDNTTGFYRRVTTVTADLKIEYQIYQTPMFLMKYFAAVAANEIDSSLLLTLDVSTQLEITKWSLLNQIILQDGVTLDQIKIEHPHLPETYYLMIKYIDSI